MRANILNAKFCKQRATFFRKIIPTDIDQQPYYDDGVSFRIGFVSGENNHQFNVPNLRTVDTTYTIYTFKDLDIKTGDKIRFDFKDYFVVDVNYSFYQSTRNQLIKQYFMTIKWQLGVQLNKR